MSAWVFAESWACIFLKSKVKIVSHYKSTKHTLCVFVFIVNILNHGSSWCLYPSLVFQWNEVTRLFRAGMPLKKHRQNFRHHASCFSATAAVDWLHQLLCNNSNFGPDVTRQQTVQLLKKFLKNHVIEDVKGRWGTEDLEDNNVLYR